MAGHSLRLGRSADLLDERGGTLGSD